jgi:integrase
MSASLFRRGGIWHAKLKLKSWAKERRVSLGTRDKRCAHSKLAARLKQAEYEEAGLCAPSSIREAAIRPLEDLCASFLMDMRAREKSANTLRIYSGALKKLRLACGWRLLRDVTSNSFCEWRKDCGLRPKTVNDYLSAFSRFLRWLRRQQLSIENPLEFVEPVDGRASRREYRRALTPDEVGRLLESAPHPRCVVYRFLLDTGLRRREANGLRWSDFQLNVAPGVEAAGSTANRHKDRDGTAKLREAPLQEGSRLVARSVESGREAAERPACEVPDSRPPTKAAWNGSVRVPASLSKNRNTDVLPLSGVLVAELQSLRKPDTAPFQLVFKGLVPEVETVRRDLGNAGIPFEDAMGRRVDLHSLRKTFGTALVLTGAHPRTVMQAMRHSDLKLTMKVYTDAGQIPVGESMARLPWHRAASEARTA